MERVQRAAGGCKWRLQRSLVKRCLCPFLTLGLALRIGGAQDEPWTQVFDMTTLPLAGGWFGPEARMEVEDGVLRIVDPSTAAGSGASYNVDWEARPEEEAVAEARMKVVFSQGDAGVCLWVSNASYEEGVIFFPDRVALYHAGLSVPMDTVSDFHVYRVSLQGQDLRLWVDGELVLDATGRVTQPAHQGRSQLSFGSASSPARGESLWDWVRFRSPLRPQLARRPPEMETITIFREPDTYSVFPSLAYDPESGRLSVAFRAGGPRSHIDGLGSRTVTMVSDDGGRTWVEGPMLPLAPFRGPGGRALYVACKWWQEYPEEKRPELEAEGYLVESVRPGVVAICTGAYRRWSDDGGATWQTQDIELPFLACLASGMNSLQLEDGTILFPVYGMRRVGEPDRSWVLRSEDYGDTWELVEVGSHESLHLNEPAIVQTPGGRLLIVMRTGVGPDHMWQAVSDDGGKTWHGLRDTGVKGHPPDLLVLQDGRILLTYGYRHMPFGIRAVVSSDDGETWDLDHIWMLRDDGGGFDLGYPRSVQLADGTVVTVYYFHEPGGMQYIACTRWRVP